MSIEPVNEDTKATEVPAATEPVNKETRATEVPAATEPVKATETIV